MAAERVLRRAGDRVHTGSAEASMWHCMSYGAYYDPANTGFGALVACNDITLAPGAGYPEHAHAGVEIVSWVLAGQLTHRDADGAAVNLSPGSAQVVSTGDGFRHAETNDGSEVLRFVQMWVWPATAGGRGVHDHADFGEALRPGRLVPVASGDPASGARLRIDQPSATLSVARPRRSASVPIPAAGRLQVYVTAGPVLVDGVEMAGGDELRITGGDRPWTMTGTSGSEALVWSLGSDEAFTHGDHE